MLGITYATVKDDDQDGLSYPRFLDALLEMAFECGRNVAADLQAGAVARRSKEEAMQVTPIFLVGICFIPPFSYSSMTYFAPYHVPLQILLFLSCVACFTPYHVSHQTFRNKSINRSLNRSFNRSLDRSLDACWGGQAAAASSSAEIGGGVSTDHRPPPPPSESSGSGGLGGTLSYRHPSPGLERMETLSRIRSKVSAAAAAAAVASMSSTPSGSTPPAEQVIPIC